MSRLNVNDLTTSDTKFSKNSRCRCYFFEINFLTPRVSQVKNEDMKLWLKTNELYIKNFKLNFLFDFGNRVENFEKCYLKIVVFF